PPTPQTGGGDGCPESDPARNRPASAMCAATDFAITEILPRASRRDALLNLVQPFGQLDVRAPGILDERDRDVEGGDLAIGDIELDAVGFELLGERLEILDLE